jgi:1,4-dihydroxy-6-naphthoate synthase
MAQKVVVAHSPDSDDAFMFYGLATGKIRSSTVEFVHELRDIQTLNDAAYEGRYEMTAISYHAYPYVADRYILTSAGSSVGDGYGPIVVSKHSIEAGALAGKTIAIPGLRTTAYLTLKLFEPNFEAKVLPFDEIIPAVVAGEADAGLVIHEGQLNFQHSGVHRNIDLGAWWKQKHNLPLPLGGNVVLRSLDPEIQREIRRCFSESIQYSLDHRAEALEYAMQFARGLDSADADKFVGMYVNHYTVEMKPEVVRSAQILLDEGVAAGIITKPVKIDYV